jgi:hypothetical protein
MNGRSTPFREELPRGRYYSHTMSTFHGVLISASVYITVPTIFVPVSEVDLELLPDFNVARSSLNISTKRNRVRFRKGAA